MLHRRSLILGACALAGCESPPAAVDFEYADLIANRDRWGRVHHLTGDSLFRGFAIGVFADLAPPTHPLYRFRSIASMANWALQASGSPDRFVYMYPIVDHGSVNAADIRTYIQSGVIRAGDTVTLEYAGHHDMNPDNYQAFWQATRAAVSGEQPVTSVMMDMFDFPSGANLASSPDYQYETPFQGRTMNDATRAAAMAPQRYTGRTVFIPMRDIATALRGEMLQTYGLDPFQRDGVHMRVWAQLKMTGAICRAVGARITNVAPLIEYAVQNLATLRYGSANFDASAAEHYVRAAFAA